MPTLGPCWRKINLSLSLSQQKKTENVKKWIQAVGPLDMLLYTDGSREYDGTGAGWVVPLPGSSWRKINLSLSLNKKRVPLNKFWSD